MKTILIDAINTFFNVGEGINHDLHKLLETYPNNKIILTNAPEQKQIDLGFVNMPYKVFTLNFDPEKTNPKYYEIFLKENNLNKDDVIYFEHNIDAINSAKSIGINTYHYNKYKRDLKSLKEFLDNNL